MRRIAMLSMHTSPLAQPGVGDGGGMNVYVREMASALARTGVMCEVFTRANSHDLPGSITVEPGLVVHYISAGPTKTVAKEDLFQYVEEFGDNVASYMRTNETSDARDTPFDVIHANYWLSGIVGHRLKHDLGIPLVSTFHTLDRVKAEAQIEEIETDIPHKRQEAEAAIIACSDAVLASCSVEADQLGRLYAADPDRVFVVSPGVDHAFFGPGDRDFARKALGLAQTGSMLLFAGRLQPLKGADVALRALADLRKHESNEFGPYRIVMVGGPSGPHGAQTKTELDGLIKELDLSERVISVEAQPHELLSTYYRAADVCLVPSRSESFGLVALEASACGTPVVASGVGGLTTLVDHGRTGYLVDDGLAESFAKYVRQIVEIPLAPERFSTSSVLRSQLYTWREAAKSMVQVFEHVASTQLVECR